MEGCGRETPSGTSVGCRDDAGWGSPARRAGAGAGSRQHSARICANVPGPDAAASNPAQAPAAVPYVPPGPPGAGRPGRPHGGPDARLHRGHPGPEPRAHPRGARVGQGGRARGRRPDHRVQLAAGPDQGHGRGQEAGAVHGRRAHQAGRQAEAGRPTRSRCRPRRRSASGRSSSWSAARRCTLRSSIAPRPGRSSPRPSRRRSSWSCSCRDGMPTAHASPARTRRPRCARTR